MNKEKQARITEAVKDILWMARRYMNGRKSYGPDLFNDAYDTLRTELGDVIDNHVAIDHPSGTRYYDISIEHTKDHPYAMHGNENAQMNQELDNRKFYKKP